MQLLCLVIKLLSGKWSSHTSCEILFWLLFCSFSVFSQQLHCVNYTLKDNSAWLPLFPCLTMSLGSICKLVVRPVRYLNIVKVTILLSFPCPFLCLHSFFFQKESFDKFTNQSDFCITCQKISIKTAFAGQIGLLGSDMVFCSGGLSGVSFSNVKRVWRALFFY